MPNSHTCDDHVQTTAVRPSSWSGETGFSGSCPAAIGRGSNFALLSCDDVELLSCFQDSSGQKPDQGRSLDNLFAKEVPSNKRIEGDGKDIQNRKTAVRRGSAIIFRSPKSMAQWARKSFMSFKAESQNKTPIEVVAGGYHEINPIGRLNRSPSRYEHTDVKSSIFQVFEHSSEQLVEKCVEIFQQLELHNLCIGKEKFRSFVNEVRTRMPDNPYHNWYHVVDVAQTVFSLALQSGLMKSMCDNQRLALIVAALCHDLEHPGVTSAFLIKTCSALAAQYSMDVALLEKHHSSCASELMTNPLRTGLLDGLASVERDNIVAQVRTLIFATDMTRHEEYIQRLETMLKTKGAGGDCSGANAPLPAEEVPTAAELLLKCADMSNVFKPFPIAKQWAVRITDEFFQQGDLERSMGLDVTPLCDRGRQSRVGMQRGFVDFVAPFYRAIGELLPALQPLEAQLARTRAAWEEYASDAELLEEFGRQQSP